MSPYDGGGREDSRIFEPKGEKDCGGGGPVERKEKKEQNGPGKVPVNWRESINSLT